MTDSINPAATECRRVLIIEDNEDARQPLAELCTMWGHDVRVAGDGTQGLAIAHEHRPHIAFVDIGLPDCKGYDLARALRAQPGGDDMVIVAFTGYGTPKDRELAREAGFDLHVVKPVDVSRLRRLLEFLDPAEEQG